MKTNTAIMAMIVAMVAMIGMTGLAMAGSAAIMIDGHDGYFEIGTHTEHIDDWQYCEFDGNVNAYQTVDDYGDWTEINRDTETSDGYGWIDTYSSTSTDSYILDTWTGAEGSDYAYLSQAVYAETGTGSVPVYDIEYSYAELDTDTFVTASGDDYWVYADAGAWGSMIYTGVEAYGSGGAYIWSGTDSQAADGTGMIGCTEYEGSGAYVDQEFEMATAGEGTAYIYAIKYVDPEVWGGMYVETEIWVDGAYIPVYAYMEGGDVWQMYNFDDGLYGYGYQGGDTFEYSPVI